MKRSAFFEKTVVLIISNIITGTLLFIFSIVLSKDIGPGGMGLYQLVMPIYIMFLCITGGGITISLSKIAAEKKALGKERELYKTISTTCMFEVIWSSIIALILILSSAYISNNILNDKRTFYSIIAFSPAIIIVSISSVYKGAYYGLQRVVEPAVIDIFEKLVRIGILYILIKYINNRGLEYSSAAAVVSLTFGELASLILFYIAYKNYVLKNPGKGDCDNRIQLIINVLKLAIPLAINGILATIFTTIITILIPRRLQVAGIPYEEALALFGKLQGMALTIAFYPTVVIGSLNVLLIPSISEAVTFNKTGIVNHRINTAFRVAAITAFSSCALILSMPINIGLFFYNDKTVGELLMLITPTIPLVYFEITTFAILNGLGKQTNLLINSTILSIFDLVLLYVLLGIPSLNIYGYALNFALSAILGILLNLIVINKSIKYKFDFYNSIILPLMCGLLSFLITKSLLLYIKGIPIIILTSYLIFCLIYFPAYYYSKRYH
jgi:stage V sporulation protein B